MIYFSNCKINIGLNIIDRYSDGYHAINTIFYPVTGLCDAVEIVKTDNEGLIYTSSGIDVDCSAENNLCVRAYNLVKEQFAEKVQGVQIHLHKNIPTGAGLGGGSANATFVIKALDELFSLELDEMSIKSIASMLGSDTSFFVDNIPSIGKGRGGELTPIVLSLEGYWLTIVKSPFGVSTAKAYSMINVSSPKFDLSDINTDDIGLWREYVVNDFEKSIFGVFPILEEIKNKLYDNGAVYASMSGSGSSIYAISTNPISLDSFSQYGFCFQQIMTK